MYGEWACSSDFYQFGPASPRIMMPSNIQYSIGGKTSHSAYNINLAFDVNNSSFGVQNQRINIDN